GALHLLEGRRERGARLLRRLVERVLSDRRRERAAQARSRGERRVLSRGLRRDRLLPRRIRLRQVEAGELARRRRVLRAEPEVAVQCGNGLVGVVLRLVGAGEVAVGARLLRVLLDSVLRLRDRRRRRAAAAEEVEVPAQEVADPGRAGAHAEEDEAQREDAREEDE